MKLLAVVLALLAGVASAEVRITIVGIDCMDLRAVVLSAQQATVVCVRPLPETRAYLLAIQDLGQFVTEAYQVLLWRQPDGPGWAWWRGEILAGRRSREQMVNALIDSSEYQAVRR